MQDKKLTQMKDQIKSYLNKKDFYDILGINKTASDTEIKKAYRQLALRFHPDKNSVQGAKQVFKKITNAYASLIDKQKRERYDRFGPQQQRPQPQYHRHAGAYAHGDQEFEDFDDIFRAFFGGVPMHHRRQAQNTQGYRFQYQQNNGQQQAGAFNFYYVFIVFFVIYAIIPLFQRSPSYSPTPTYQHRIRRTTSKLNVQFYVSQNFFEDAKNPQYKKKAEMSIDKEYVVQLQQSCEYLKKQKRTLEAYAYQQSAGAQRNGYLNRAKAIDMSYCRMLNQLKTNNQDYMTELAYYR